MADAAETIKAAAQPDANRTPAPARDLEKTAAAPAADAVVEAPAKSDAEVKLDGIVDRWIQDQIHNSPVARSTEAYNHLLAVLPDLKAKILIGE